MYVQNTLTMPVVLRYTFHMSTTKPLEKGEIDALRGLANRCGVAGAARVLDVARTSLLGALSGLEDSPIDYGTIEKIRRRLAEGAVNEDPPPAPTPARMQARPPKVRA
jgi:hypothetical protein